MRPICKNCLHQMSTNEKLCPICLTPIKRKRNRILTIGLPLLIVLIFCSSVLSVRAYHTASKIENRFMSGIENRQWKKIQATVVHDDLSPISSQEAQALIELVKQDGELKVAKRFKKIKTKSLLEPTKMTTASVSLASPQDNQSISVANNNMKNVIPGIYKLEIILNKNSIPFKKIQKIEITQLNTPLEEQVASFKINWNIYSIPIDLYSKILVKLNNHTAKLSTIIDEGPFLIFTNDLSDYQVILDMPWGKITSKKQLLDFTIDFSDLKYVSNQTSNQLDALVKNFTDAISSNTLSSFKDTTDELKKRTYKAPSNKLEYDMKQSSVTISTSSDHSTTLTVHYYFETGNTSTYISTLQFKYIKSKNKWIIVNFSDDLNTKYYNTLEVTTNSDEWINQSQNYQKSYFTSIFESAYSIYPIIDYYQTVNSFDINSIKVVDSKNVMIDLNIMLSNVLYHMNTTLEYEKNGYWEIKKINSKKRIDIK